MPFLYSVNVESGHEQRRLPVGPGHLREAGHVRVPPDLQIGKELPLLFLSEAEERDHVPRVVDEPGPDVDGAVVDGDGEGGEHGAQSSSPVAPLQVQEEEFGPSVRFSPGRKRKKKEITVYNKIFRATRQTWLASVELLDNLAF